MTREQAIQKLLDCARAEIGYHEQGENLTKYAAQYDYDTRLYGFEMSGQPWCDYFVDWCFMKTFGFNAGSLMTYQFAGCSGASCQASAGYYRANFAIINVPEPGDQIFFYVSGGINHTGLVESVNENIGTVTTIEGNSSDSVKRNTYPLHDPKIAGYGRPAWQLVCGNTEDNTQDSMQDGVHSGASGNRDGIAEEGSADSGNRTTFHAELDADSEFGPLTEAALLAFQKSHGLQADAMAGPETWDEISLLLGKKTLKKGCVGWAVTALQAALNAISEAENGS